MAHLKNKTLTKLFVELHRAVDNLTSLAKLPRKDFLGNYEKIDTAKYNFLVSIEVMIDICSHIIAENNLGAPEDLCRCVSDNGQGWCFSQEFVGTLIEMIKFRNLLVHVYWKVEDRKIYDFLQRIQLLWNMRVGSKYLILVA